MSFPKASDSGEGWQEQNHVCACAGCGATWISHLCLEPGLWLWLCVCKEQPGTEELSDAARSCHGAGETPGEASQVLQAE